MNRITSTILLFFVLIISGVGFLSFSFSLMGFDNPLSELIPSNISWGVIPISIGIEILTLIGGFLIFVLIIKMVQNPILGFIDSRWLPEIKPIEELTEEEIETKSWTATELGERHEATFIGDWWATTFLYVYKPILWALLMGFFLGIVIFFSNLPMWTSILIGFAIQFLLLLFNIPRYLLKEWLRKNTLLIMLTHNIYFLEAKSGGLAGLITGQSEDVNKKRTPLARLKSEPQVTTDPRRIFFPNKEFKDFRNTLFDLLGSTKQKRFSPFNFLARGVRTVFLPSWQKDASDYFVSLTHGESAENIILSLVSKTFEDLDYSQKVLNAVGEFEIGSPKDPESDWESEIRKETASRFFQIKTANMHPKSLVNLWSLRTDPGIWDHKTGRMIQNPIFESQQIRSVISQFEQEA